MFSSKYFGLLPFSRLIKLIIAITEVRDNQEWYYCHEENITTPGVFTFLATLEVFFQYATQFSIKDTASLWTMVFNITISFSYLIDAFTSFCYLKLNELCCI